MDVHPVVVGPHQRELHAAVVRRAEEALVQPTLQERAILVVVPIEQEDVDPVVGGRGDLARHGLWVGFILVAPSRHARLVMAGEARLGALDQLPLGPARAVRGLVARVDVVVGEIVAGDGVIFGHGFLEIIDSSVRRSKHLHFADRPWDLPAAHLNRVAELLDTNVAAGGRIEAHHRRWPEEAFNASHLPPVGAVGREA